MTGRTDAAVRLTPRSALVLALASAAGVLMFAWPLLVPVEPASFQHASDAPFIFALLLPVALLVVFAELSEGGMDTKALAMLGVFSAINAALRMMGAGTAGVEMVFFMLVLCGRVFGPGFGFSLGCISLFASALITAGVGPWLPFQMMGAAWVGLGAGLLPRRVSGRAELAMLAVYGALSAYFYGFMLNLWFWPFISVGDIHGHTALSYVPGAPVLTNLYHFCWFTLITSTGGWDTGRAITNVTMILVLGRPVLATLRRASDRAAFGERGVFGDRAVPGAAPSGAPTLRPIGGAGWAVGARGASREPDLGGGLRGAALVAIPAAVLAALGAAWGARLEPLVPYVVPMTYAAASAVALWGVVAVASRAHRWVGLASLLVAGAVAMAAAGAVAQAEHAHVCAPDEAGWQRPMARVDLLRDEVQCRVGNRVLERESLVDALRRRR